MRKLPVGGVLGHALRSVFSNFRFAWHVSWPWLIILLPLSVAVESALPPVDPQATDAAAMARNAQAAIGYMAFGLISMLVFSSIAVSWHRYILLDEVPQGSARLRLDTVVWRYFANTILIALAVIAACVPVIIVMSFLAVLLGFGANLAGGAAMALAGLLAIPLSYRLMVKLPAIAVGNTGFGMRSALEKTAGNSLQLCLAGVMLITSAMLVGMLLGGIAELFGAQSAGAAYIAMSAMQQLVGWIVTLFTVTYLTSLYGFFVEGRDF